MTKEEAKIISESMVEMGKVATANTLGYVKAGFEAFKKVEIPVLNQNGECIGLKTPYKNNMEIQNLVDFMITFLDESIKNIDNQIKKDEAK